jgi:hypothetical protein
MMTQTHEYRIAVVDFERNVRRATIVFLGFMAALGAAMLTYSLRESVAAAPPAATSGALVTRSFGPIVSHLGHVSGEVIAYPPAIPMVSAHSWTVILESAAGMALENASVRVRVWMPETEETMAAPAVATPLGNGRYEISRLRFTKAGWWNVALSVAYAGGADSLAFNLMVPEHGR